MKVEIVDFYPMHQSAKKGANEKCIGTIRVKIVDMGFHILGIRVFKSKKGYIFFMPGKHAICHKTQKNLRFPFFSFDSKMLNKHMMEAIREKAPKFINEKMKSMPLSVGFMS